MIEINERYITDADGNRVAVVLDMEAFERLMAELEDLEDLKAIRAYEAAKAAGDPEAEAVPLEQVITEYEAHHAELQGKAS
jgi:PHD/YefM family antitoxin component YafN of YafNO toxin-antitoxin module